MKTDRNLEKFIPLYKINVLPQMRQTFEDIDLLAENIYLNGLIHPITVVRITNRNEAKKYLSFINAVYGTKIKLRSMVNYWGGYLFLIAGERRLRACKQLFEEGKGNGKIRTTLRIHMSAEEAIDLQGSENTNFPVPPHEEALFYDKYFRLRRKIDPHLTLTEFGRKVGRTGAVIRTALRFAELPEYIRTCVSAGHLKYGIACELARLQEAGCKGDELKHWFIVASVNATQNVDEFRRTVKKFLDSKNSNQESFLSDIFSKEEDALAQKFMRKRSIEKGASDAFSDSSRYFLRILYLFENKYLGLENSPFSSKGPLSNFKKMLDILKRVNAHMEDVLNHYEASETLKKSEELVQKLQKIAV